MSHKFVKLIKKLERKTRMELSELVYAIYETKDAIVFVREDEGADNYYIQQFYKQASQLGEPLMDGTLGYCISRLEMSAEKTGNEVEYV